MCSRASCLREGIFVLSVVCFIDVGSEASWQQLLSTDRPTLNTTVSTIKSRCIFTCCQQLRASLLLSLRPTQLPFIHRGVIHFDVCKHKEAQLCLHLHLLTGLYILLRTPNRLVSLGFISCTGGCSPVIHRTDPHHHPNLSLMSPWRNWGTVHHKNTSKQGLSVIQPGLKLAIEEQTAVKAVYSDRHAILEIISRDDNDSCDVFYQCCRGIISPPGTALKGPSQLCEESAAVCRQLKSVIVPNRPVWRRNFSPASFHLRLHKTSLRHLVKLELSNVLIWILSEKRVWKSGMIPVVVSSFSRHGVVQQTGHLCTSAPPHSWEGPRHQTRSVSDEFSSLHLLLFAN